ncbi:MAG: RNA 2',3'-cyclic phosphodiesterase [Elusimicrobia bacterium]|nr:RNA 2',3'-cyclic phosphodiesterase [Elusimicrobiota bacterium]
MRLFIASGFPAPFIERVNEIQVFAKARLERAVNPVRDKAPQAPDGRHERPVSNGVKWVEPQNMHLTYAFLGSFPEDRVPAIKRSLEASAGLFKKFEVALGEFGAFPSLDRPRVLWLGLKEKAPGRLNELALKIYEALLAEGFILEHRFSAHLTIGRVKSRLAPSALEEIRRKAAGIEGRCLLTSVDLMESLLSGSGPEYKILASRALL